jgi:hypothetical protein
MDTYTIKLERIHVSKTRSPRTDTNYLTFSVKNGSQAPYQINAKLGDMPDGDYSVGDLINRTPQPGNHPSNASDLIEIANPQDPVIINWAIMNRGHAGDQQAMHEIQQVGDNLIDYSFYSGSGTPAGMDDTSMDSAGWGSHINWGQIVQWVFAWLVDVFNPNCDGGVVAQTITTSAAELATKTQSGTRFEKTLAYPGTDSAIGRGANSLYFVTYSITHKHFSDDNR